MSVLCLCVPVEQTTCMENLISLLDYKKELYIQGEHAVTRLLLRTQSRIAIKLNPEFGNQIAIFVGADMQGMDKGYLRFPFYQIPLG